LLGRAAPQDLLTDLRIRYREPHRRYHTIDHVLECLDLAALTRDLQQRPAEVDLALWFHDAVYDPARADNEEQSAALARQALQTAGLPREYRERIDALILTTRHDADSAEDDAAVVADIDLSILGAEPERFDEYEAGIRDEYAWVPQEIFRSRRAELLRGFLTRRSIYALDFFRDRLDAQARTNLCRSLKSLGG
jgi:predicted metal-dependent HD superfamily phosphohydrolase